MSSGNPVPAGAAPTSRRRLDPDRLVAMEEERDFLLRSLDDLDAEHRAGDLDDHDYDELRDDYTVRAATKHLERYRELRGAVDEALALSLPGEDRLGAGPGRTEGRTGMGAEAGRATPSTACGMDTKRLA